MECRTLAHQMHTHKRFSKFPMVNQDLIVNCFLLTHRFSTSSYATAISWILILDISLSTFSTATRAMVRLASIRT